MTESLGKEIRNVDEMLEVLASLEHEQWMSWSKTVATILIMGETTPEITQQRVAEKIDGWKKNWKPYSELDEETKEHDRVWARPVLNIIKREIEHARQQALKDCADSHDDMIEIHVQQERERIFKELDKLMEIQYRKDGTMMSRSHITPTEVDKLKAKLNNEDADASSLSKSKALEKGEK